MIERSLGQFSQGKAVPQRQSDAADAPGSPNRERTPIRLVDLVLLALVSASFYLFLRVYAFDTQLSEWDLYLAAIGLWDGHQTGEGIAGTLHYGKWHSFGYIQLIYALSSAATFDTDGSLFRLMNATGFWATIACLPLLWAALATRYSRKTAALATAIFIGSPVFLELAGGAHPILPALAGLLMGTAFLWYPARGSAAIVLRLAAAVILCAALTLRFEVVLAFPLLVLAPPQEPGWKNYLGECLVRLGATLAACVGFVIVRSLMVAQGEDQTRRFVENWYSLDNIPTGVGALILAIGLVSTIALVWAVSSFRKDLSLQKLFATGSLGRVFALLGPFAVMAVTLLFWIANPLPARHFLLFALGAAIVIAVAIASRLRRRWHLALAAVLLVGGNQVIAGIINPYVVETSGFAAKRAWPYLLTAPSGTAWDRRAMLKEKWSSAMHAGRIIASGECGRRLVVSAPLSSAVVAQMVSADPAQSVSLRKLTINDHVITTTAVQRPVHALVYTRESLQEPAFPKGMVEDARLRSYQFAVISDVPVNAANVQLPASRIASPNCAAIGPDTFDRFAAR